MKRMNHTKYKKSLRTKTMDELEFIMRDAYEAAQAYPDNENSGYYLDEVNYCNDEINRRKKIDSDLNENLRKIYNLIEKHRQIFSSYLRDKYDYTITNKTYISIIKDLVMSRLTMDDELKNLFKDLGCFVDF